MSNVSGWSLHGTAHHQTARHGSVGSVDTTGPSYDAHRFSIHARERSAVDLKAAQQGLPARVPGTQTVYANGW